MVLRKLHKIKQEAPVSAIKKFINQLTKNSYNMQRKTTDYKKIGAPWQIKNKQEATDPPLIFFTVVSLWKLVKLWGKNKHKEAKQLHQNENPIFFETIMIKTVWKNSHYLSTKPTLKKQTRK